VHQIGREAWVPFPISVAKSSRWGVFMRPQVSLEHATQQHQLAGGAVRVPAVGGI